ncbi:MAG: tRNA lysidine(34) synthetase TilS, partial [Muribaculaceae bacterium]|nr:tRNA lysidine(34) synthetase TilS [Muribaculaceae bacterium]
MDLSKVVTEAFAPHHISNVVAGISGGADSTALLVALSNANIDVTAIHCNFNLRGSESDGDESFVRTLCDSLGIRLKVCNFDVNAYVSSHKVSVEMACRELRYDAFREVMSETGAQRIAVAHNSDDQVETLMLNLLRGTGISGLRAMREDTGEIIRPFINITRREIEEYLREMGFTWRTDSTNLESHYLRNFLRNDVLPLLETRWPRARKSLLRTSSNLSSDEKVLADIEERLIPLDSELLLSETVRNFCNPEWNIRRFARRYGASDRQIEEITEAMLDK